MKGGCEAGARGEDGQRGGTGHHQAFLGQLAFGNA
jgi:hypothetical protein